MTLSGGGRAPSARGGLRRFTPIASPRTQLMASALMWSLAGTGLCVAGAAWTLGAHERHAVLVLAAAAVAGALKAHFLLRKTAGRIVQRIIERGDGHCIGGFLSWKSWLLVAAMILLGRFLRRSPLPIVWRGAIYFAIGTALLSASRVTWCAWRACRKES
jgi:hypothetical protein